MKTQKPSTLFGIICLGLWLFSTPAAAIDLAQAKAEGLVGEQMNGFLGLVSADAPAEVRALVTSINGQRQAEYQRIAAKNGVAVDEVARLTAQKVINNAAPGHFVQTPSGWQQR